MTDEQINIAIAEACGLFHLEPLRRTTRKDIPSPNGVRLWYCESHHKGAATYVELPDYVNDLNAMHEAEQLLPEKQQTHYADVLFGIVYPTSGYTCNDFKVITATARQRALAFIKTLNLTVQ